MADIDAVVFDIQDVGARFYTYISTMHYVMEACAENDKELIVLDRPNPNDYIDGSIRQPGFRSFVGVDPIPLLHGLTVGELASMINGEGWLKTGENSCKLEVVTMLNWKHGDPYWLPVKPSPNLPNDHKQCGFILRSASSRRPLSVWAGELITLSKSSDIQTRSLVTFLSLPLLCRDSTPIPSRKIKFVMASICKNILLKAD